MFVEFWEPVRLSIQVASLSCFIVLVTGIFIAKIMARKSFKGKLLLETMLILPLVLPPSVIGFILLMLLGNDSPVGQVIQWLFNGPVIFTWFAAVIASTVVAFPLMYQSAKTGFEMIDSDIENAARVDGASEAKVFWLITIKLAGKSLVMGGILSFARGLGEFGATLMVAGNLPGRTQTIPTAIYFAMDSGNMTLAWAWVIMIILLSFLMLTIVHIMKR
ncbi:molybdate ABC transporter permease subunit [Bacillus salitolerans]|uniref:Molybdenum transport system permease n=1 Tax=Bacillus salitolerans TaxID=1437434 RepID=A0ABW4LXB0_9BACI